MNKTPFLAAVLLLLVLPAVSARSISQHSIQIEAEENGDAYITEQYFLSFDNSTELALMRARAREIGADIQGWQNFDAAIFPHIGIIKPGSGKIGFEEKEGDRFVKIEYVTRDPLFISEETSRRTTFHLDSRQFASFQTGSVYTISTNTKIVFLIPRQAGFNEANINPEAEINYEAKRFVWSGYRVSTGNLEFGYWLEKQIAPSIGISSLLQDLLPTSEFKILLAIGLLGMGMIYFKRNSLQQKIEKYLIENSSLEKETDEQKIELE